MLHAFKSSRSPYFILSFIPVPFPYSLYFPIHPTHFTSHPASFFLPYGPILSGCLSFLRHKHIITAQTPIPGPAERSHGAWTSRNPLCVADALIEWTTLENQKSTIRAVGSLRARSARRASRMVDWASRNQTPSTDDGMMPMWRDSKERAPAFLYGKCRCAAAALPRSFNVITSSKFIFSSINHLLIFV